MTKNGKKPRAAAIEIDRVQTGVRIEKRILKVARALADLLDMSLGIFSKESCSTRSRGRPRFLPKRAGRSTS